MSQPTDPRLGSTVGGYRIDSQIGRGGMSVVYLAEDAHLGRKVAVKFLAPELVQDSKFRERFVRESRLAASLEHPNIVTVYEARESDGQLYLVMRYVAGTDLKRLIGSEGALDPERTVSIISQAASALDAAHAEGLIHRDVKPGNILITPRTDPGARDRVYLSDFGLTKRATSDSGITATGQFVGTLDYAAPEQFEARPQDARADVYSLGCVLYECLTGEVPYPRENQAALVYAHLHAPAPKATAVRPDLPGAIDRVVATAMAKEPQDRYRSAGDLAEAAAQALGVQPVAPTTPTRPAPPGGRLGGPSRNRLLLIGAGALVVAAAVVGLVLANRDTSPATTGSTALVDYVARVNPSTGRVSTRIKVGKDPVSVAIAEGSTWVANSGEDSVSRIDPVSGKVTATINVGRGPFAVVAGEGAVWVAKHRETTISKIDPATNQVTEMDVGVAPQSMAVGEGAIWIAFGEGFTPPQVVIQKFDARAGRQVGEVVIPGEIIRHPLGTFPWAMAAGGGSLWAGGGDSGKLYQIDPQALNIVGRNALSGKPIGDVWVQGDSVWAGVYGTPGTVFQVDAHSADILTAIPAGGSKVGRAPEPMAGAADDRAVWVTDTLNGTVSRIVVLSGEASAPVEVGKVPTDVAVGFGSVWVIVDGKESPSPSTS